MEAILVAAALGNVAVAESLADQTEAEIKANADIPETEKEQLIKARRGQGLYRSRLESVEAGCRVTGVTAKEHLRASHIKPWRSCDNREKLDGNNGFLLAPHIDHLFDRGYISFEDDGSILLSPGLDYSLLTQWKLDLSKNVGKFNRQQKAYLDYHRQSVFQR